MWGAKTDWKSHYYQLHSDTMSHLDDVERLLHDAEQASREQRLATADYRVEQAMAAIKEFKTKWTT